MTIGDPARPPAPRAAVAGRVLLLLIAAGALVAAWTVSRRDAGRGGRSAAAGEAGTVAAAFTCPMHGDVAAASPGDCPVCGMALVPRAVVSPASPGAPGAPGAGAAGRFSLPAGTLGLIEYDFARATRRRLTRDIVAPAWMDSAETGAALLYRGEGAPGAVGRFRPAVAGGDSGGDAGLAIEVRISDDPPAEAGDGARLRVGFRVAGAGGSSGAGAPGPGWLEIPGQGYDAVMVPSPAILPSPEGPYLFIASQDGRTFTRRAVEIGRVLFGFAVVRSGVLDGERVVVKNPIFVAAEQRLAGAGARERAVAPPAEAVP